MASALVNRLVHVHLRASADRLAALGRGRPASTRGSLDYLTQPARPPVVRSRRRPRSRSPRRAPGTCSPTRCTPSATTSTSETLRCSRTARSPPAHAVGVLRATSRPCGTAYGLEAILKGDARWPRRAGGPRPALLPRRDVPRPPGQGAARRQGRTPRPAVGRPRYRAKALLVELAEISLEVRAARHRRRRRRHARCCPPGSWSRSARDMPRLVAARPMSRRASKARKDPTRGGRSSAAGRPSSQAPAVPRPMAASARGRSAGARTRAAPRRPGPRSTPTADPARHPTRRAEPAEWAWVLAHLLAPPRLRPRPTATARRDRPDRPTLAARCVVVNRFLRRFTLGRPPCTLPADLPRHATRSGSPRAGAATASRRVRRCCGDGRRTTPTYCSAALAPAWRRLRRTGSELFAAGLAAAAAAAMDVAGGRARRHGPASRARATVGAALSWFVSSYPLLGALAAGITIVADAELARAWGISDRRGQRGGRRDLHQPAARTDETSGGSCSPTRCCTPRCATASASARRDPYLLNVACDYVINGWLVEMGVGDDARRAAVRPGAEGPVGRGGVRPDRHRPAPAAQAGHAARARASATCSASRSARRQAARTSTSTSSTAARSAPGLAYHQRTGRGLLPAGLVEEIRALDHPPLPWDAQLARWFDEYVPPPRAAPLLRPRLPPAGRHPGHPARRAGSGPRRWPAAPSAWCWTPPARWTASCSARRWARSPRTPRPATCPRARVVFCDAAAYDAGYLPVDGDRRPGAGARPRRHRAAARHRPAGARRRLPGGRPDPGHHRRLVRRAAGPARARVPDPGRCVTAVHRTGAGVPRAVNTLCSGRTAVVA